MTHRLLQTSSYSVGLAYELLVMEVLSRYSFQLKHTGGAGDGGQDFNGYLVLPEKRVPVVGINSLYTSHVSTELGKSIKKCAVVFNCFIRLSRTKASSLHRDIYQLPVAMYFHNDN